MNSPDVRRQIQATATGTKVRHTAPERIRAVETRLPPLDVQRTIAAVLDWLDDLIENNRRRVYALEEMARAVYHEWFVHFRYPGHENVTLVDSSLGSIPDRWAVTTLGQVLELRYGKALKKESRSGGKVAVVSSAGVVGWHNRHLTEGPTIVVGRKGNVGSVTWVDGPCWPIDTAYYVETDLPLRYVVEQLRRTEFLNTHAAVPGLSREQAYSCPFLHPPDDLMKQFDELSQVLASQASAVAAQAERLVSMRDLLLPKLVTGQIDLSSLDLEALVEESVA
jgi:type I restriction enzyme, S subunit